MEESTTHSIRSLTTSDQSFLWEMLYQSLYVPEGGTAFERGILDNPDLAIYAKDWGRANDFGFIAEDDNAQPLGAIWLRLHKEDEKGFGYVDDNTPELALAVRTEDRGRGIGTSLLHHLLVSVQGVFGQISLSVSVGNPAIRLYQRFGFEVVDQRGNSITMTRKSQPR